MELSLRGGIDSVGGNLGKVMAGSAVQSARFGSGKAFPKQSAPDPDSRRCNNLWIIGFGLVGLTLKLVIALNTYGSTDVVLFHVFAKSLSANGLEWTYQHSNLFNHPPLVAYYLKLIFQLDHQKVLRESGFTFPVLLRLPGIVADFIVVMVLLEVSNSNPEFRIPRWALALLALSPVSLMVSGFHGNTDPIMVMFLVLAAYACLRDKPALSGLFLALSCQIKIVPLLLVPIFFFFWFHRRKVASFLFLFVLIFVSLWSYPLVKFPVVFAKNVLSYSGCWGVWGITYWLRLTGLQKFGVVGFFNLPVFEYIVINALKLVVIIAVLTIAWRRRKLDARQLFDSVAYSWIVFFVFSPCVCAQYMVWFAPFVLVLSPLCYSWLTASSALFLFFFYHITAGEFPWYIAMSKDSEDRWTPWTIFPWVTLIFAMILLWKKVAASSPPVRLVGHKQHSLK